MQHNNEECEIIRLDKDFLWPGDKRLAINFNIAYEMWTPGNGSSVNPMGNVLNSDIVDPNAESYGRYNVNAGCRRLFDIMEREGVSASVFTSGLVAEHHGAELKRLADAGHEIIGHGYGQDQVFPHLSDSEAEDSIRRSTVLIEQATGQRPTGWVSPRITSDRRTHRKFCQHGYKWHGDALDADLPYLERFAEGDIMVIPCTIDFNDLPHAMRFGRTPDQFVDLVMSALNRLLSHSNETLILDIIVHGHCYGRPAAAWAFAEIVMRCARENSLWLTTRGQIHDYVSLFFAEQTKANALQT